MSNPSWASVHSWNQTSKEIIRMFLALSVFIPKPSLVFHTWTRNLHIPSPLHLFLLCLNDKSQCLTLLYLFFLLDSSAQMPITSITIIIANI